ncbi:MAG: pentapeptide repeat-containing protein, partial [Methylococcaceae bacterium]
MIAQALPEIFEQLEDVKKDASELRNFTITFLSLLLYINLIIVNTDAEQILRVAPVNLPLLNVPLPIISFYGFVPWLLLLFHLYLLIQHYLFSQQLFLFKKTLYDGEITDLARSHVLKNLGNLPFLHWMIGEHHVLMQAVLTLITLVCLIIWPLLTLLWLQMAILPYHSEFLICWQRATILLDVLLIAWLWTKTLANNDSSTTWWKLGGRGCYHLIVFAPYLLWWRIATTFRTSEIDTPTILMANVKTSWHDALNALALALSLFLALFLSLVVATLPDSWQELQLTAKANSKLLDPSTLPFWLQIVDGDSSFFSDKFTPTRVAFWPTAWLHEQHAHIYPIADTAEQEKYNTLRAKGAKPCESLDNSPKDERTATNDIEEKPVQDPCLMVQPLLPRNLILREKVLTATIDPNLKPELEAKLNSNAGYYTFRTSSFSDTRSASLNNQATLADALAQVVGLNLQNRNFDYADFTELSLPKVDLRYASLKHATLTYTQLEQAHLESAHLADPDMTGVNLTGADMSYATLTGADMRGAKLIGADMRDATLTGADMRGAKLIGTDMYDATLTGADMRDANLTGANMRGAKLIGADMRDANLTGAILIHIDTDMPSEQALKKITADYEQQLASIPDYQTNPSSLATEINNFKRRLSQPAVFSGVKEIKPCLRSDNNTEKALHDCKAIGQ